MNPFISICIPAYKNATYLKVLLDSVAMQTCKDYEVVITDDSPDDAVEKLCNLYNANFTLTYTRNIPAKGSPANWNESIRLAKGQWIKIMHDDDWFASEQSLQIFATAAKSNPLCNFIFSGYSNYKNGKVSDVQVPGSFIEKKLRASSLYLIATNYIGHPSTTLIKNNLYKWYDEKTKWIVDIEFYIRCLQPTTFYMLRAPLINIGIGDEQITTAVFRNPKVEIPEHLYLLQKMGVGILKNQAVYDHYWRLFRNLGIRDIKAVESYAAGNIIPAEITKMLKMQFTLPLSLLRIGAFSKPMMLLSYLTN